MIELRSAGTDLEGTNEEAERPVSPPDDVGYMRCERELGIYLSFVTPRSLISSTCLSYPPPEAMRDADVVAALAAAFTRHMEPLRGYGAT